MSDDTSAAVIVTSASGDTAYAAAEFLHLPDGSLLIGPDSDPVAVVAPGQWSAVRRGDALQAGGNGAFDRCPTCGTPKTPATP
jgi:hypothetical protein